MKGECGGAMAEPRCNAESDETIDSQTRLLSFNGLNRWRNGVKQGLLVLSAVC